MGVIGVAIDKTQDAARYLAKKGADLLEAERRAVGRGALFVESAIRRKVTNDRLRVQTGALRASVGSGPIERASDGAFESRVGIRDGNARAYARIQEEGGTVTPKGGGRLLAIPVGNALTRSKAGARTGVSRSVSPLDYRDEGGFWLSSKRGKPLFVVPKGKGGDLDVLFVGVPSVTIRPKWYVRDSYLEGKEKMPEIVREEVAKAVASA